MNFQSAPIINKSISDPLEHKQSNFKNQDLYVSLCNSEVASPRSNSLHSSYSDQTHVVFRGSGTGDAAEAIFSPVGGRSEHIERSASRNIVGFSPQRSQIYQYPSVSPRSEESPREISLHGQSLSRSRENMFSKSFSSVESKRYPTTTHHPITLPVRPHKVANSPGLHSNINMSYGSIPSNGAPISTSSSQVPARDHISACRDSARKPVGLLENEHKYQNGSRLSSTLSFDLLQEVAKKKTFAGHQVGVAPTRITSPELGPEGIGLPQKNAIVHDQKFGAYVPFSKINDKGPNHMYANLKEDGLLIEKAAEAGKRGPHHVVNMLEPVNIRVPLASSNGGGFEHGYCRLHCKSCGKEDSQSKAGPIARYKKNPYDENWDREINLDPRGNNRCGCGKEEHCDCRECGSLNLRALNPLFDYRTADMKWEQSIPIVATKYIVDSVSTAAEKIINGIGMVIEPFRSSRSKQRRVLLELYKEELKERQAGQFGEHVNCKAAELSVKPHGFDCLPCDGCSPCV